MLIYFNGDSNTAGTELVNPVEQGFAGKLAKKLGASFINQATAGAANDTIYRTTREFLITSSTKPDLIIIGWSDSGREEWFYQNKYQSVNSLGVELPDVANLELYQYWKEHQGYDIVYLTQLTKYWNSRIYQFHLELEFLKIPHLFFNAIESFVDRREGMKLYYHGYHTTDPMIFNWNNKFINPYQEKYSMINHLESSGHKQITPGWFHYGEPAQEEWAELMYNHIKQHNIL